MDKQTRKLNFKKLQLPTSSKQRTTRSNKETATSSISNYFNTPKKNNSDTLAQQKSCKKSPTNLELNSPNKPKCKRTKLNTFLNKEEDNELPLVSKLPKRESDVFEKAQPKVRKAPKLTATTTAAKKSTRKGRTKKQPSIKSAFLRNEEVFSEITAQHCIADNFSPDDIELALALSKSETQTSVSTECTDQPEEVVDLNERDSVRSKLQKYGFRTASKEDYNTLTIPFLAGINRGKRSKWANKFTALTLRNPEHQAKKLKNNIDSLLAKQFKTKPLSKKESLLQPYKIISNSLRYLESQHESKILANVPERDTNDISCFYVKDLFEVSSLPAGHLLKNWSEIQGRDLSPERQSERSKSRIQKLKEAYANLELHFFPRNKIESDNKQMPTSVAAVSEIKDTEICVENVCTPEKEKANEELDELLKLIDKDQNKSESLELSLTISSPIKEPPDKRARMQSVTIVSTESNKENLMLTRSTSPDIFGDSDGDDSVLPTGLECEELPTGAKDEDLLRFSMKAHKHISIAETSENIETFEIFSSDDVKNSVGDKTNDTANDETLHNSFIDLTADENEPLSSQEIKTIMGPFKSNCEHSLLNVSYSYMKSPDREVDQTNLSLKSRTKFDKILNQSSFSEIKLGNELNSSSHDQVTNTMSGSSDLRDICGQGHSSNRKSNSFSQSSESPIFHHSMKRKSRSFVDSNHSSSAGLENSLKTSLDTFENSNRSSSFSAFKAILQESANSIDLTQNVSEEEDNDGDCILLSDDEINYSIWKADKTLNTKESELLQKSNESSLNSSISNSSNATATELNSINLKTISHPANDINEDEKATFAPIRFDRDEELDAFLVCSQTYSEKSGNSRSPNKSLLSRERAEFGIMDAALSEPISFSQLEKINGSAKEEIDWTDASFLDSPSEQMSPIKAKRYSCNKNKFSKLLSQVSRPTESEIETLDDMDEFDKIVFGAIKSYNQEPAVPSGLDQLLTAEINFQMHTENESPVPTTTKSKKVTHDELKLPEEVEVNGNIYTVRVCRTPKPDFTRMSDAEMLKQLYNYGIKPLKRTQAIKMLEFVYNQTHPIMFAAYETEQEPSKTPKESTWCKSKSTPVLPTKAMATHSRELTQTKSSNFPDTNLVATQNSDDGKIQLHDAFGDQLLRYSQQLRAGLVDDDEYYVLQTNVTKKTPQPLLPLHIAWHNLLCGNPELHEKVLMYEPIDLQEIYLFLKSLGYRYDPKELKSFFDRRCIIFRYELTAPNKQTQRHVRNPKRKK